MNSLYAFVGAFFGAMTGTIYCVRLATKHLWKLVDEDPDMKKIEVNVTMVEHDA